MAKHFPNLTAVILQLKNRELHIANNKVYFKNPATNWYVCLDIFWQYCTVRKDNGQRFDRHPYFDLDDPEGKYNGDGKDEKYHFWNTQKAKKHSF